MDRMRKEFGHRLYVARFAAGFFKQIDFAAALGISPARLSQWERGLRTPDIPHLQRICTLTGISADYLYFGKKALIPHGLIKQIELLDQTQYA